MKETISHDDVMCVKANRRVKINSRRLDQFKNGRNRTEKDSYNTEEERPDCLNLWALTPDTLKAGL